MRRKKHPLIERIPLELLEQAAQAQYEQERRGETPWYCAPFKAWYRRYPAIYRLLAASVFLSRPRRRVVENVIEGRGLPAHVEEKSSASSIAAYGGMGCVAGEAAATLHAQVQTLGTPTVEGLLSSTVSSIVENPGGAAECLLEALESGRGAAESLWSPNGDIWVVHILATRCSRGEAECRVPRLLSYKRVTGEYLIVDPGEPGGVRATRDPPSPEESVALPASSLPWEAPGYRAYAVEIAGGNPPIRRFIVLSSPTAAGLASWLSTTRARAESLAGTGCTPIPEAGPAGRLRRKGFTCWEQLYPPRLLASLKLFIGESERRGCGNIARSIIGSASRTLSLLAYYNPRTGKVNPAFNRVRGFAVPRQAVVLNPYSYKYNSDGTIASIGRGTLASYIEPLLAHGRGRPGGRAREGTAGERRASAAIIHLPPQNGDPGLSLLYSYWHGHPREGLRDEELVAEAAARTAPGAPIAVIVSGQSKHRAELFRRVAVLGRVGGLSLRSIYWVPVRRPGRGQDEVVIAVYRAREEGPGSLGDPLWALREAVRAGLPERYGVKGFNAILNYVSRLLSR